MVNAPAPAQSLLLRTPLYDLHLQAGAKMVEFAGWLMPLQYRGILAEHQAVRTQAGVFDLSHMGRFLVRGPQAAELVQWLTVNDTRLLAPGQAQYSLFCNRQGGVLDDVVVYNLVDHYLIVVNAANRDKLIRWIQAQQAQTGLQAELDDATHRLAMIGVQGPFAQKVLQGLVDADLESLGYYRSMPAEALGPEAIVTRTGYTGEDGFEVVVSARRAPSLWSGLLERAQERQGMACGLGARDTLRLEAGMHLYGHELSEAVDPFQAGLGRLVKWDKGEFVGHQALAGLREQPRERRLVGFRMVEPAVPRQGYAVLDHGREVGWVTSGGFAPTLKVNLGLAYVPQDLAGVGQEFDVLVRGRPARATVVPLPFYPHRIRQRAKA